jgi:hypothetical protein
MQYTVPEAIRCHGLLKARAMSGGRLGANSVVHAFWIMMVAGS